MTTPDSTKTIEFAADFSKLLAEISRACNKVSALHVGVCIMADKETLRALIVEIDTLKAFLNLTWNSKSS